MDKDLKYFCDQIVSCLVQYGGISLEEARHLLESKRLCDADTAYQQMLLFHEPPYYWAMELLYADKNPQWHLDPKLWPPPQEYLDSWYNMK